MGNATELYNYVKQVKQTVNLETSTAIYYLPSDAEFVQRLAADLRDAEVEIELIDTEAQKPASVQAKHEHLLIVLSAAAIANKRWIPYFRAFQQAQKPISVVRADATPMPAALNQMNWIDFDIGYRVGLNGLLVMLRSPNVPPASIDLTLDDPTLMDLIERRMQRGTLAGLGLYVVGTIALLLLL